jgi:ABC-type spermidine/putrescine transport system permease subunit I
VGTAAPAGAITGGVALRVMPVVGAAVIIDHLGSTEHGVVASVDAHQRSVAVTTDRGRALTFVLNRATATFTSDGGQTGSRLRFEQAVD